MERRNFIMLGCGIFAGSVLGACGAIEPVRARNGGYEENERRILGLVLAARRSGLVSHHLGPAIRPWAGNGKLVLARGNEPDSHDVELNYNELLDMWLQQMHGPVKRGLVTMVSDADVKVLGSTAKLSFTLRIMTARWTIIQREVYELWLADSGWLVLSARWFPLEEHHGRFKTQFSSFEWRRRDGRVKESREMGDRATLVDALRDAHRWPEAHDELEQWTKEVERNLQPQDAAKVWALRGLVAVEAGRARDALPSFRNALRLDPEVSLPQFKAADDARVR